jgi:hypothetical protein
MVRGLAGLMLIAMIVGIGVPLMLGWAYEGPRRLLVRLKGKTI